MRQFIIRTAGILTLLATILLLEGFVSGDLSLLGFLCLAPASAMATARLLGAGAHSKPQNRRKAAARRKARALRQVQPALRVAAQPHRPNGPWAA